MKIKIDGYLLQSKLESALKQIVGQTAWIGRETRVSDSVRCRWDMTYTSGSEVVVVEFDADAHYRDSLRIKVDRKRTPSLSP